MILQTIPIKTPEFDKCAYCGLNHKGVVCHRIKMMEFDPHSGNIVRVEFFISEDASEMLKPSYTVQQ